MEIDLKDHELVLAFLIIILIIVAMTNNLGTNAGKALILVVGVLVGYCLFYKNSAETSEHMEEPRKITTDVATEDGQILINTDDRALSQYGNISTSGNVDTLFQRHTDLDMTDVQPDDLDNSDMIQAAMQKGSSIFQPNTAQGVTASQGAFHSNFKLAQPGMYMEYSVPINPRGYNADEALARKQQHRADINKKAIDGAVRSTRNVFEKYFKNELNENEEREWWSAEAQNFETDFRPYY